MSYPQRKVRERVQASKGCSAIKALRVGYVNVNGLARDKWVRVVRLLEEQEFDFLFVAETWFVDHADYKRAGCFLASTPNVSIEARLTSGRPGRDSSGLYLLGNTKTARANMKGRPVVSKYAITFRTGKDRIAGVYYPPALTSGEIKDSLTALKDVTVILGDINTRFRNCDFQSGNPTTPAREQVFRDYLRSHDMHHKAPDGLVEETNELTDLSLSRTVTTDHCFIKGTQRARLRLLLNRKLLIRTDHLYTLSLYLDEDLSRLLASKADPIRFRIGRLHDEAIRERAVAYVDGSRDVIRTMLAMQDVDELNSELVKFSQELCERVLGRQDTTQYDYQRAMRKMQGEPSPYLEQRDQASSIRLYKNAQRSDDGNRPIVASPSARLQGLDELKENFDILRERYTAPTTDRGLDTKEVGGEVFTANSSLKISIADVRYEIMHQDVEKSCGREGIHIRLLRTLVESEFVDLLTHLYTICLRDGRTPSEWNYSDIHLILKDKTGPADSTNLRPITLICIFRKVFERLLLLRFDGGEAGWARLHPHQAGFRHGYSTCTNAAVVHHLLHTSICDRAVFLDLQAAFDRVDHRKLYEILEKRRCPSQMLSLIRNLMLKNVSSRIIVNRVPSKDFRRTRGVLQGSPLSPYLFSIFIDGLLHRTNRTLDVVPRCLFFADDGVILGRPGEDLQCILNDVSAWVKEMNLELNVRKCGFLASEANGETLYLNAHEAVPRRAVVKYLGFPMVSTGINFKMLLTDAIESARGRCRFLSRFSDVWGPYHRLQVFKVYIAPMIEYGAPLLEAWRNESEVNEVDFQAIVKEHWGPVIGWVSNAAGENPNSRVECSIYGILPLSARFSQLRTLYQVTLDAMPAQNPLKILIQRQAAQIDRSSSTSRRRPLRGSGTQGFLTTLIHDNCWEHFTQEYGTQHDDVKKVLRVYINARKRALVLKEAASGKIGSLIPEARRGFSGIKLADRCLTAPRRFLDDILAYRKGKWLAGRKCLCNTFFRRFHEDRCETLKGICTLSTSDTRKKHLMERRLSITRRKHHGRNTEPVRLTVVDYLLNTGRLIAAGKVLGRIRQEVKEAFERTTHGSEEGSAES